MSILSDQLISLSVFFPFYNEQDNIKPTVEKAVSILTNINRVQHFEIIIVNDGSSDNTLFIANKLAEENSNIRVITHKKNMGYGSALISGIKNSKYEYVFFTDGDLQFDFSEIKKFLDYVPKYDAIIGYRSPRKDPLMRLVNAWGWKILNRVFFGLKVKDIDCAFKLFKREIIAELPVISCGAMISAEILIRLQRKGIKFKEIPVSHFARLKGSPTGAKLSVIFRALKEFFSLYKIIEKFYLREFVKYFIVGCGSVILDVSTLFIFKKLIGLSPVISVVINQLIICNYVFFLNKFWVFSKKKQTGTQIIKYYALFLINYLIAITWMWFFYNILGYNYILVRVCNIALSVFWNFLIYKYFIYI